jgi:hypothetical protein
LVLISILLPNPNRNVTLCSKCRAKRTIKKSDAKEIYGLKDEELATLPFQKHGIGWGMYKHLFWKEDVERLASSIPSLSSR